MCVRMVVARSVDGLALPPFARAVWLYRTLWRFCITPIPYCVPQFLGFVKAGKMPWQTPEIAKSGLDSSGGCGLHVCQGLINSTINGSRRNKPHPPGERERAPESPASLPPDGIAEP
jgi:hypothetical protein